MPGQSPASETSERRIVTLRADIFPGQLSLLGEYRAAVIAKDQARAAALIAQLEQGSNKAQVNFASNIKKIGGRVTQHYWLISGATVEIPKSSIPQLRTLPDVQKVWIDQARRPHIKIATNANNHNADSAQAKGMYGSGASLALLDSGIDALSATTNAPHPAFDLRVGGPGSRLIQAVGIAKSTDTEDLNGHGTGIAAIAMGKDWGASLPVSDHGYAPDAKVISYKITLGKDLSANDSDVIAAWHQVAKDRISNNLAVANLSYEGSPDPLHPTQMVLDQVAFYGDVLIITSAGNDGLLPFPTASSQSNASGISVGAIWPDTAPNTHQVTDFSSFGPLPGDGARWFPDLVAVGVGVASVKIDDLKGHAFNTGTSFSAPQVAGTSLLIRSAQPTWTHIDAKAVILNNVQDIAALNPAKTRSHYGIGMLRTDLATEALAKGSLARGLLLSTGKVDTIGMNVAAGKPYAVTLVWPRMNTAILDWDNLDLQIKDPNGRLIAISASKRNLYEKILFTATKTGTYTLNVKGTMLNAPTPYSISYGENLGGGRQTGSYSTFGSGCPGSAPDPAVGILTPPAAVAFGNARTRVPFSYQATRLQQVVEHSWIKNSSTLSKIAFRRDEQQAGSPSFDVDLEIYLGYTANTSASLSTTFANNVLGSMTKVLDNSKLSFPGTSGLPESKDWDFVLPLDTPFTVQTTASKHLLVEIIVRTHSRNSQPFEMWFDAIDSQGLARIYTDGLPNGAQGNKDSLAIVMSLMSSGLQSRKPVLHGLGTPQLGSSFQVSLIHAKAGATAVLAHGNSNTTWGNSALPLDFTPFGAPGCTGLTDMAVMLPMLTNKAGQAGFTYTIPLDPTLTGVRWFNQWLIIDPSVNSLGIVTTNGTSMLIGG